MDTWLLPRAAAVESNRVNSHNNPASRLRAAPLKLTVKLSLDFMGFFRIERNVNKLSVVSEQEPVAGGPQSQQPRHSPRICQLCAQHYT